MAPMKVIKIPKTPKSAYNPGRPASALLRAQVEHLEAAVGIYAGDARKRRRPRTEGEAAKYIEELTRALHPEGAAARPAPDSPTVMPPAVRRARPQPARSRKRQSSRRKTR